MNLLHHWLLIAGIAAVFVSIVASLADRRRLRRAQLDRVGFVPWTGVFFLSLMIALLCLGAAAKLWVSG